MADGSSGGTWLRRWRIGCWSRDAERLLGLLDEDHESGGAKAGDLKPAHVAEGAKVACEVGDAVLLRKVIGVVEEGACVDRGMFDGAFREACWAGHVGLVRELLGLSGVAAVDVHAEGRRFLREGGFIFACQKGHLDVVRELLALTGERAVDVHVASMGRPEGGFRRACGNGHVEVVRELLSLSGDREVDVHAGCRRQPDLSFHRACTNGHVDVLRELLGLTGHRAIPLHTRLGAGQVAVQPAKDAVWAGTSTRRGRRCMVLLREAAGR